MAGYLILTTRSEGWHTSLYLVFIKYANSKHIIHVIFVLNIIILRFFHVVDQGQIPWKIYIMKISCACSTLPRINDYLTPYVIFKSVIISIPWNILYLLIMKHAALRIETINILSASSHPEKFCCFNKSIPIYIIVSFKFF